MLPFFVATFKTSQSVDIYIGNQDMGGVVGCSSSIIILKLFNNTGINDEQIKMTNKKTTNK